MAAAAEAALGVLVVLLVELCYIYIVYFAINAARQNKNTNRLTVRKHKTTTYTVH